MNTTIIPAMKYQTCVPMNIIVLCARLRQRIPLTPSNQHILYAVDDVLNG